jgi:hypothetical protein
MKTKIIVIALSSFCVILTITILIAFKSISNNKRDKYPGSAELISFRDEHKDIFLNIVTAFSGLSGYIDNDGYVCYYDEERNLIREYIPNLSDIAREYYKLASDYCILSDIYVTESGVAFEFRYEKGSKIVGIEYTTLPCDNDNYTEIDNDWYFYEYPYMT